MDLLFSKYASPFLLLEQMILVGRFSEFVREVIYLDNERKLWELYLAAVSNPYAETGSFEDFKNERVKKIDNTKIDLKATINNSFNILNNFKIEGGNNICY